MNNKILSMMFITSLFLTFFMTQDVMAKKIVYMGHAYNGKVNKQKIPEGRGTIKVGDLLITGIFNGQSVTNAEVRVDDNIGDLHNCTYRGAVTYDDSNDIVLKASGIFSTRYFPDGIWGDLDFSPYAPPYMKENMKEMEETLEKDKTVNSENFELKSLSIPFDYDLGWGFSDVKTWSIIGRSYSDKRSAAAEIFKIPTDVVKTSYSLNLVNAHVKYRYYGDYDYYTKVFAPDIFPGRGKPYEIGKIDFEDSEGRKWSCNIEQKANESKKGMIRDFIVTYPDGSYYKNDAEWKIVYPDGYVLKCDNYGIAVNHRGIVVEGNRDLNFVYFVDVKHNNSTAPYGVGSIKINSVINEKTESEIGDILNSALLKDPHFKMESSSTGVSLRYYRKDWANYDTKGIGTFEQDGKYISDETKEKAKREADTKKAEQEYQALCKKYSKKYVDAAYAGKFLIGMPLGLLDVSGSWQYKLVSRTANSVVFDAHYCYNRNPTYRLYLTNDKITRIYQYR